MKGTFPSMSTVKRPDGCSNLSHTPETIPESLLAGKFHLPATHRWTDPIEHVDLHRILASSEAHDCSTDAIRPYRSLRGFERNRDITPTERLGRITRRIITLKTIGFVLVASLLAPLAATALRSDDTSADLVVAAKELSRLLV